MSTRLLAAAFVGIVGCSRQENRRALRTSRNQDDRIQLDAVAHRDHRGAPNIIETFSPRCESRRYLALELRGWTRLVSETERRSNAERNRSDSYAHILLLSPVVMFLSYRFGKLGSVRNLSNHPRSADLAIFASHSPHKSKLCCHCREQQFRHCRG